jgi:hypothetical protein
MFKGCWYCQLLITMEIGCRILSRMLYDERLTEWFSKVLIYSDGPRTIRCSSIKLSSIAYRGFWISGFYDLHSGSSNVEIAPCIGSMIPSFFSRATSSITPSTISLDRSCKLF